MDLGFELVDRILWAKFAFGGHAAEVLGYAAWDDDDVRAEAGSYFGPCVIPAKVSAHPPVDSAQAAESKPR